MAIAAISVHRALGPHLPAGRRAPAAGCCERRALREGEWRASGPSLPSSAPCAAHVLEAPCHGRPTVTGVVSRVIGAAGLVRLRPFSNTLNRRAKHWLARARFVTQCVTDSSLDARRVRESGGRGLFVLSATKSALSERPRLTLRAARPAVGGAQPAYSRSSEELFGLSPNNFAFAGPAGRQCGGRACSRRVAADGSSTKPEATLACRSPPCCASERECLGSNLSVCGQMRGAGGEKAHVERYSTGCRVCRGCLGERGAGGRERARRGG